MSSHNTSSLIRPSDDVDNIIEWFQSFDDIQFDIIDEIDDISVIEGTEWINKSGWEKIAHAFNMSVGIDELKYNEDAECWRARAIAKQPLKQRYMTGVAMAQDKQLAMTRAVNRAVSDMVAAGRVSAEEIL